jgi:acyl-CoA synthetase (AMP-forming)/AMP-acid ligase II
VHHFLERSAREHPAQTALVHGKLRASYAEVNRLANQLARRLREEGLERGGRVALLLENSLEYAVSYYGVLKAGGVVVPLSPEVKGVGLDPILDELEAGFIISGRKTAEIVRDRVGSGRGQERLILKSPGSAPRSPGEGILWEAIFDSGDVPDPPAAGAGGDSCSIIYTSGSTGRPKGVVLSHANIVANTLAICEYLELTAADIQMAVLPFFYVMGQSLLNTHFAVGGQVVINNQFAYPAAVVQQMAAEKVTGFSGVPATYAYLLYRSPLEKYRDKLPHLRYCSQAGGHMPLRLKTELRRVLPAHTKIFIMYGATEAAARIAYVPPEDFERKMDSVGKPVRGMLLRVINAQGREAVVGEHGELVASGPNIMQGYWKNPQATAQVLDADGYHTGDVGFRDTEGFFYVVGRRDEMLKVGGHRLNPQEVEDAILSTGLVVECAVVGLDDALLGKRLAAAVVLKDPSVTPDGLLRACRERLPKHKLPSAVAVAARLPLNSSGKVDKKGCQALVRQARRSVPG